MRIPRFSSRLLGIVAVIALLLCVLACFLAWIQQEYIPAFDELTRDHGDELKDAIDYYFAILDSDAAFYNPRDECPKVATGKDLGYCLISHTPPPMHNFRYVQNIRVMAYEKDCSIAIVIYHSVGTIDTEVFLLVPEDGIWKVSDRAGASIADPHGGKPTWMFGMANPPIPFSCSN